MPNESVQRPVREEEQLTPGQRVARMAKTILHLDPASAAALRRGPLAGAGAAAYWKILAQLDIRTGPALEPAWAALVQAIAVLTPKGERPERQSAHNPAIPFGAALFAAEISELRLARLLNTPRSLRPEASVRICRRLASAGHNRFDLKDLYGLLLNERDWPLRKIAREYYRAEAARPKTSE